MTNEMEFFTFSFDLKDHPINHVKLKQKKKYYLALEELVSRQLQNKVTAACLEQYRIQFFKRSDPIEKPASMERIVQSVIQNRYRPWKKEYRCWLMCDAALILSDPERIGDTAANMGMYLSKRRQKKFYALQHVLTDNHIDPEQFAFAKGLISQYRKNRAFAERPIRKMIITANMSAGKSTLINALIGKKLARTSQEVCTGNVCYFYNKPYEDGRIYLENEGYTIQAEQDELKNISWELPVRTASYFRGSCCMSDRFCIIDTPGVNSTVHRAHGTLSREVLLGETYEKAVCVLNADKLGTEEELAHIRWVAQNVEKEKVIFVLNKVDDFKTADDNLAESMEAVKRDLLLAGFENPLICPVSAYFALLIKLKEYGDEMTEDEEDEYAFYVRKFQRPAYNLVKYYDGVREEEGEAEAVRMSKKCGLYGLEKILFGGTI